MSPPAEKPGLSVKVRASFFLLAAILAYGRLSQPLLMVEWLVVVSLSVLAHELGHAMAYRLYGHGSFITLHGMGGATQSTGGPRLTHLQNAFVSVAGPLAGFLVAAIVLGVSLALPMAVGIQMPERLFFDLLWVNVGWSIFNLLPIVPMDGGHILQSMLRHRLGARAEVPALVVSLLVAVLCGIAAYRVGWTWSLVLVLWMASSNVQALLEVRRHQRLAGVRDIMKGAVEAFYAKDFLRAGSQALQALSGTTDSQAQAQLRLFVLAVESAAEEAGSDDPRLAALRREPLWQAALETARAAQRHDPTKVFT